MLRELGKIQAFGSMGGNARQFGFKGHAFINGAFQLAKRQGKSNIAPFGL